MDEALLLPQDRETPATETLSGRFSLAWGYARSKDCQASNDLGQDSLSLRFDTTRLAFALCDGVSQSFFGDLAARVLGRALVDHLWSLDAQGLEALPLASSLSMHLDGLTAAATRQVQAQPIAPTIPALLRNVLEKKRALGSQSTFACGLIDAAVGVVALGWMGDTRIRIFGPHGERSAELGNTFRTEERWSSAHGLIGGVPHTWVAPLDGVTALLAFTDGVGGLERYSELPPPADVQALVEAGGEDDATWLAVRLLRIESPAVASTAPVSAAAAAPPPPRPAAPRLPLPHAGAAMPLLPPSGLSAHPPPPARSSVTPETPPPPAAAPVEAPKAEPPRKPPLPPPKPREHIVEPTANPFGRKKKA